MIGGINSIGRVAEFLSPLEVGLYLVGGVVVIVMSADWLPHVLGLVFSEAPTTRSAMSVSAFPSSMVTTQLMIPVGVPGPVV